MGISIGDRQRYGVPEEYEKCAMCRHFFPPEEMSGDCCGDCAADIERQAQVDEERRHANSLSRA